jgi:hypothetical protein
MLKYTWSSSDGPCVHPVAAACRNSAGVDCQQRQAEGSQGHPEDGAGLGLGLRRAMLAVTHRGLTLVTLSWWTHVERPQCDLHPGATSHWLSFKPYPLPLTPYPLTLNP